MGSWLLPAKLGDNVVLICATRGEAGESGDPSHTSPEALGTAREAELRAAMKFLNVDDVRFLGYRDSGMEGSAEAQNPGAFVQASLEDAAARLVPMIREIQPDTIVTFGEDGVYGHPDHVHLHHVVKLAVNEAGDATSGISSSAAPWRTPFLYFATAPREDMEELLARPQSPLGSISERARANLGTPRAQITNSVDVSRWEQQNVMRSSRITRRPAKAGRLAVQRRRSWNAGSASSISCEPIFPGRSQGPTSSRSLLRRKQLAKPERSRWCTAPKPNIGVAS